MPFLDMVPEPLKSPRLPRRAAAEALAAWLAHDDRARDRRRLARGSRAIRDAARHRARARWSPSAAHLALRAARQFLHRRQQRGAAQRPPRRARAARPSCSMIDVMRVSRISPSSGGLQPRIAKAFAMVPFSFAGHDFLASPDGALHWPAERALLVADLHLEKASWFARLGQLLPPYDQPRHADRARTRGRAQRRHPPLLPRRLRSTTASAATACRPRRATC